MMPVAAILFTPATGIGLVGYGRRSPAVRLVGQLPK